MNRRRPRVESGDLPPLEIRNLIAVDASQPGPVQPQRGADPRDVSPSAPQAVGSVRTRFGALPSSAPAPKKAAYLPGCWGTQSTRLHPPHSKIR
jgi:hypothetical protein